MSDRTVKDELLDHLDPASPEAIRSRRDLKFINALMGNSRWLESVVRRFAPSLKEGVVEIGAGEGLLCRRLAELFPNLQITGVDLVGPPHGAGVAWKQGDLFSLLPECEGDLLIGGLIIHHFTDESLQKLGRLLAKFRVVAFCEPRRSAAAHLLGRMLHPLINSVTQHDMHISIDAGFGPGELPDLLGLNTAAGWRIEESSSLFGALRVVGYRV
jgi:hypothetical protein